MDTTTNPERTACRACACERDNVCDHGNPHTCEAGTASGLMLNLAPDNRIAKMVAAALQLDAEATPGPWETDGAFVWGPTGSEAMSSWLGANCRFAAGARTLLPDLARELEAATARVTSLEATNVKLAEDGAKLAAELQEHERRLTLWRSLSEEERVFALATMREAARGLGLAIGRAHWWAALLAFVEPAPARASEPCSDAADDAVPTPRRT